MSKYLFKDNNGGSNRATFNDVVSLEGRYTANQKFASAEHITTANLGNTKLNFSRYKDTSGQRSSGRSLEQVFGKDKNKSIAVSYTNPRHGSSRYNLTATWKF